MEIITKTTQKERVDSKFAEVVQLDYDGVEKIMDEIAALSPIYVEISFDRIESVGLQSPCPDKTHLGTRYLHKDKFTRGKGKFHPVQFKAPAETPDDEYPFVLSTDRRLYQFRAGTMTRKSKAIDQVSPTGYVKIHSSDAEKLIIADGDSVEVITNRGKVRTIAKVTNNIGVSWLFMPFHFSEAPANTLTTDALDPTAKIPEYKSLRSSNSKNMAAKYKTKIKRTMGIGN